MAKTGTTAAGPPEPSSNLAGTVSRALDVMAKAPPGTVPFIFGLMALFFATVVLMTVMPKDNVGTRDVEPIIFAFFGLIIIVLTLLIINGLIHSRERQQRMVETQETYAAISALHSR